MADTNNQKEVVIKLTAATKEFISNIRDADKAVKGMNNDIAGAEKLAKDLSDQFKQIDKVFMAINSNYISKSLANNISKAQLELDKFLKTVSDMSSASGINDVAKSTKDAAKAMADAGKDVAVSLKDTSKVASDASKKISDAEKTASEAGKKIKEDLNSAVKGAGIDKPFTVTASVDGKEIESAVQDAQKAVEDASDKRSKTLPFNTEASVDGESIDATVKDVRQLSKDLSGMKETVGSVAEVFTTGLGSGSDSVSKVGEGIEELGQKTKESAAEMVQEVKDIGKEAEQVSEEMSKKPGGIVMSDEEAEAARQARQAAREALDAERERKKVKEQIAGSAKAEQKSNQVGTIENIRNNDALEQQQGYRDAIAHMGKGLSDVYTTIRAKLNPAYAESERRVARLAARQNELIRQREKLANTRYHSAEWNDYTKELQRTRAAMNALEVQQRNLETQMQSGMFGQQEAEDAKKKYSALGVTLEGLRQHLEEVTAARAALKEGTGKPGSENPERAALNAEIDATQRQIDMIRASGSGLFSRLRKHTHSESKKISTILKNTLNHIKRFFSQISLFSNSKSAERGLKRISNAFTKLWGMFRTRLKRRFISAVFEDAKNDMVQLAKAFPSMNDAISGVVNSAKALGAQLISILQPIITAVGPLVTKVLDGATIAADKIAQFSAKLFGQNTYGKATKGNYDFVKSMDETSKSVSGANKALTDYSSNLLGFDKLNQLQAVGDDSKASISAVDTDPVQNNAFNKWAEELKDLWDNKDWDGFGRKLADGLNTAVTWINNQDWDALSNKVTGFIANIQKGFNGFIDAFDAKGVGKAIANIGNLIIDAWNQLVKPVEEGGFDTYKLGQKIGTIIVTALQDIKWDEAGVAFGNTGSRLVEMLRGILEQKFEDETGAHSLGYGIGKSITTFITNALKTINTDDWATLIADIVNNLLDMFIQIFSAGPDLGEKIADILNKSLKSIESSKLGEAISGLSRTFNALVGSIDWGGVVAKLGESLSHVDWWSMIKSIFFLRMGRKIGGFFNNTLGNIFGGGGTGKGLFGGGLLSGLLGRLLGTGSAGAGGAGGGGLLSGLVGKLGGFFGAHPILGGLAKYAAAPALALWGGNQIGRALSHDNIEAYHEFQESGQVLDTSQWDTAQRVGGWLIASIDRLTGAFDGFSKTYDEAMKAEEARKAEEYNAAKFGENLANGVSEAMTQAATEKNGESIDSLIASHILKDYENSLSRDKLEERYGMTVSDMNRRYGLDMQYDGQTAALTETIQNNTTAMQSVEASTNTSAEAMTKAVDYMKSVFESLQKDTDEGQPVNLMIDGYKFGEFVLKQLGTIMHVRLAGT